MKRYPDYHPTARYLPSLALIISLVLPLPSLASTGDGTAGKLHYHPDDGAGNGSAQCRQHGSDHTFRLNTCRLPESRRYLIELKEQSK